MANLMAIHGMAFTSYIPPSSSSPSTRRSRSPATPSQPVRSLIPKDLPQKSVSRAKSTNALSDMAAAAPPLSTPLSHRPEGPSEHSLSTLRDPRVESTSDLSQSASSSPRHPDLSSEVANLSDKLIQAINNQSRLDDTLDATRQDLEAARRRIRQLESDAETHNNDLSTGRLLRQDVVVADMDKLRESLDEERSRRIVVEKEKKNIEQELENLTAALFEEANKMVAAAKKEREVVERRNEQLRAQVKDTESLVASHQEQLAELKSVMQQMNAHRDELDSQTVPSTSPSSPTTDQQHGNNISRLLEAMNLSPVTPGAAGIPPAHSTSFSHLIKSVCRTDILAYDDFHALLQLSKKSKPPSRVGSGSYSGLNVMGLAGFGGNYTSMGHTPSNSGSGPQLSPQSATSPKDAAPTLQLKETRFYKRVLTEDIEPTLRLDTAPGISWLARRSILTSICDGSLLVEPMPAAAAADHSLSCALCGERRKGDENARTHRFRVSDNESAQRYPLCMLCLEKMRSCCDFVGYLKLVISGHIRLGDHEEEKEAWEETVRLRERMFWSRMGGGVVPAFIQSERADKSVCTSDLDSPVPVPIENQSSGERTSVSSVHMSMPSNEMPTKVLELTKDPFVPVPDTDPAFPPDSADSSDESLKTAREDEEEEECSPTTVPHQGTAANDNEKPAQISPEDETPASNVQPATEPSPLPSPPSDSPKHDDDGFEPKLKVTIPTSA